MLYIDINIAYAEPPQTEGTKDPEPTFATVAIIEFQQQTTTLEKDIREKNTSIKQIHTHR